jgi:hypothetical protein
MNRVALRRHKEKQRLRIKRAWDSGVIHAKIAQRDRSEDNYLRAKLDRKGSLVFVAALPDGSKTRVEWSRAGRTDQFDLVDDGVVTFTGRPDLAMKELAARSASLIQQRPAMDAIVADRESAV